MDQDKLNELLISHDELVIVCKTQVEVILRAGLQEKTYKKLSEANVEPGFADRADQVVEKFKFEIRRLVASGAIQ